MELGGLSCSTPVILRVGWLDTSESVGADIFDPDNGGLRIDSDRDGMRRGGSESSEAEEGSSLGVVEMLYLGLIHGDGGEVID